MFCTHCGAKNSATAQFCTSCGSALSKPNHMPSAPTAPMVPTAAVSPAMPPMPATPPSSRPLPAAAPGVPVPSVRTATAQHQRHPLWAIIVAVVCVIETVLLIWMLAAKPTQNGNKKNLEGVVNLFSMAAEGISAANNYNFRASAQAEGNTVVITVKFPSVIYDKNNSSSNTWMVCFTESSNRCRTFTERDLNAYTNIIVKDYVRKALNDFRQMTGISNLGFTVKLLDKNDTLIESVPIDKYLDGSFLQ